MIIDQEYNPRYDLPEIACRKIEKLVVDLYEELKITDTPIDVWGIVDLKGYILNPLNELNVAAMAQMIRSGRDGHSYINPNNRKYFIGYDNTQGFRRQRFTIMHEIGHILLGHRSESDLADKMANYFASYSLVPYPLILKYDIDNFLDLEDTFLVSRSCAKQSIDNYKKWRDKTKDNLLPYEKTLIELFN